MSAWIVIYIVAAHFVADFVFQSDKMAINKSSNGWWLLYHVATYSAVLGLLATYLFPPSAAWIHFVTINFVLHLATDFVTSRISSRLWQRGERHWFFVAIGADQVLHYAALFLTYEWLRP